MSRSSGLGDTMSSVPRTMSTAFVSIKAGLMIDVVYGVWAVGLMHPYGQMTMAF
jgi:hypothetical protein